MYPDLGEKRTIPQSETFVTPPQSTSIKTKEKITKTYHKYIAAY